MADARQRPSDAPRVLVVDDEPMNRDLVRRVLQNEYAVDEAADAIEAIQRMEEGSYAIVLCDQLMPGRSGSELAGDIRDRWPQTVFMLITGYEDDPMVLDAQRAGLVHFVVPKPWTARGLKELVRTALAG